MGGWADRQILLHRLYLLRQASLLLLLLLILIVLWTWMISQIMCFVEERCAIISKQLGKNGFARGSSTQMWYFDSKCVILQSRSLILVSLEQPIRTQTNCPVRDWWKCWGKWCQYISRTTRFSLHCETGWFTATTNGLNTPSITGHSGFNTIQKCFCDRIWFGMICTLVLIQLCCYLAESPTWKY